MLSEKNILSAGRRQFIFWPAAFLLLAVLGFFWDTAFASPVDSRQAQKMVKGWLTRDTIPFGSRLGSEIESVETFTDTNGQTVYYVVYLRPNGFVIVPADDLVEPVICFSPGGSFDPSQDNPLGALVSRDLPARVDAARNLQKKTTAKGGTGRFTKQQSAMQKTGEKASGKWNRLLGIADDNGTGVISLGIASISDVRVSPLLQSKWSQQTSCLAPANACYNYYTPKYGDNSANNYPCGCVATAMAQYMRFWQYPTTGVGTGGFTVYVDGKATTKFLRGGNGSGGPYSWTDMTLLPDCGTAQTQRAAIGSLTYDAGVAVHMQYTSDSSGAYMDDADAALTSTFGYSNSICGYNNDDNFGAALNAMINPNLDWGNPVLLGIHNSTDGSGHAIVADGYGYNIATLYHHLNLGWAGAYDAWYNLPNIDDAYEPFDVVDTVIYNIYMSGSGEIISGRVMDFNSGLPITGATVTAAKTGGGTYQATTNTNGIYAIAKVPSNSSYTVSAAKTGYYSFNSQAISTVQSSDNQPTSGNCWGVDLTGTARPPIPVATNSNVTTQPGLPLTITLQAADDGRPNPPGAITYIITSLPQYGTLADPCTGGIITVTYSLANYCNNVVYTPFACYTGPDSFQFKANDGGTSPNGGDSNTATVSITVQPSPQIIYETHFDTGLPSGWTIVNGGSSSDTWRSDNPAHRTNTNWTGVFMIVDSYNAGAVDMNEQLITQSINCSGWTSVKLRFKHNYRSWDTEKCDVDVRVNGGVWQNATRYQLVDSSGLVEIDLSGFGVNGDPNVQVRWHYYNANDAYYWGIDDVQIIATIANQKPAGDLNCDCDVDLYDLDILMSAWLSSPGQQNWNPLCDISEPNNSFINEFDFAILSGNWMTGTR